MKNPPGTVWVATMVSEHWEWVAVGRTQTEAELGLVKAWNRHCDTKWATFAKAHNGESPAQYYGVYVRPLQPGEGERV